MLESSGDVGRGGADDVDMKGASLKQQQWELSRMGHSSNDRGRIRKKRNRGRGVKESGKRKGQGNNGGRKNSHGKINFKKK